MNLQLLICTHILAAACGGVLGVYATQILHDLDILAHKEATVTTPTRPQNRYLARVPKLIRKHLYNVLLVVVIIAVAQGVYAANHAEGCGTRYANQLADALDQRQHDNAVLDNADARDEAAIIAVLTPGNDKADVAEFAAAVQAKAKARVQLEQGRASNPYPPAPREFCS